jgi:hypothetical protein
LRRRKRARGRSRKHAIAEKLNCLTLQKRAIHRYFCVARKFSRQMLLLQFFVPPMSMRRLLGVRHPLWRGGGYTQN